MIVLHSASSPEWLNAVLADFDSFLLDHAAAERKASAVALSLLTHYPDRKELVRAMMAVAREELEHFHQVYLHMEERGLLLGADVKDRYVGKLRKLIRSGREDYFLDRLLVSGIVEARGCERFGLIAEKVPDPTLQDFYQAIARSEARHQEVFLELALRYFPEATVMPRLEGILVQEAEILQHLEIRPALH